MTNGVSITDFVPGFNMLPSHWQTMIIQGFVISLIVGRIVQAVRNGGGLKNILASVWLGTNKPKDKTNE